MYNFKFSKRQVVAAFLMTAAMYVLCWPLNVLERFRPGYSYIESMPMCAGIMTGVYAVVAFLIFS